MKSLSIIALILLFVGCGQEKKANESMAHDEHTADMKMAAETQYEGSAELVAYYKVKDALVASDLEATKEAAMDLANETTDQVKEAATAVAEATDLNTQREAFYTLSEKLYNKVKSNKDGDAAVYKQFCPMAFKNTGAFWLSDKEEIRNPYFGDAMLTCGSVKETL